MVCTVGSLNINAQPSFDKSKLIGLNQEGLEELLSTTSNNYDSINILNELSYTVKYKNNKNEALSFGLQALEISERINFPEGTGDSYMRIGGFYHHCTNNYDSAFTNYNKAAQIRGAIDATLEQIKSYRNIALLAIKHAKYEVGKEFYQKSIDVNPGNNIDFKKSKSKSLIDLSVIYKKESDFEKASKILQANLKVAQSLKDTNQIAQANLQLGLVCLAIPKINVARNYLLTALQGFELKNNRKGKINTLINIGNLEARIDSFKYAQNYLQRALELCPDNYKKELANIYTGLGNIAVEKKEHQIGFEYHQNALAIFQALGWPAEEAISHFHIGNYFLEIQKNPTQSIFHLKSGLEIVQKLSDQINEFRFRRQLSKAYKLNNDYISALKELEGLHEMQESLLENGKDAREALDKLVQEQYKNEQLESELKLNKANNRLRLNLILSILAFVILIGIGGALYVYIDNQRKQAELKQMKSEQRIDDLLQKQELDFNYAKLKGQEQERNRIAENLHDKIGAMLATIKLYFGRFEEILENKINNKDKETYTKASQLLDKTCNEVRDLSHQMKESTLFKFGLVAQIEALANSIRDANQMKAKFVKFGIGPEERLPYEDEIQIYRIIQELASNTMKHAGATKLDIQLNKFKDHTLNIIVEDNGKGFDKEKVKQKPGIGLTNVQSRVNGLKGKLAIDSSIGRGTIISIDIPLKPSNENQELVIEDVE